MEQQKPLVDPRWNRPTPAIQSLAQHECLDLLGAEAFGRVGFVSAEGVQIIPVGYRLGIGPRLFVSTQPWGVLGQLAETAARCSFQVDHHGDQVLGGWSVLMHGVLRRLDEDGTKAYAELSRTLDAWPGYTDAKPVQFLPASFSGRSVLRRS